MAVGLLRFAGGTHCKRWMWMWMNEDWRLGTSGYLKSGSLSLGESRKCRSKFFCLPMMMNAQGREADPAADLASRWSGPACGERCDRMTHQAMPFTLCWFCSPHTARRNSQAYEISIWTNQILSIVGQGGKTASPPHPASEIQYPQRTTARDTCLKYTLAHCSVGNLPVDAMELWLQLADRRVRVS
jgi:hypothetical protein